MDPQFARRYRELYEKHWWFRAREELLVDLLRRLSPPQGWGAILDIGCGDGLFFDRLLEFGKVEGVEPNAAIVSEANPHRSRIYICPFDEAFRPDRQYSLVLLLDVLEHLADPVPTLRHALALLAAGGTLLATVPAFNLLWTSHDVLNHHFRRYTRRSFRQLARQAGLHIEAEHYLFQWTFPVKLATRAVECLFRLPPRNPTIPPYWLNQALYRLTRVEQKLLGALPVPFGSSLLVVGRKASP